MNKIIRWGIIGCGDVTEVKSGPPYQITEGFKIEAVMRRNEEKVKEYAKRHQINKWYTDADALIQDPNIDAVYVATPPDTHVYYGLKVAEAGKPCCIEKPLSPNYHESKKLVERFREKKLPLFVAYYRRSLPRFEKIKTWLAAKKIGEVRHIHWHLSKPANDIDKSGNYNWRTDEKIAPGGYFDDLASHGLDLFSYYFGDFGEVNGVNTNQQGLYKAKDALAASWIHKNGITGTGLWNFGSFERRDTVEILGNEGFIRFSVFGEEELNLQSKNHQERLFIENPKHIQQFHVENIKKHLAGQIKHPSMGETALHTSWVMDKILGVL